jgi:hypothetical protein
MADDSDDQESLFDADEIAGDAQQPPPDDDEESAHMDELEPDDHVPDIAPEIDRMPGRTAARSIDISVLGDDDEAPTRGPVPGHDGAFAPGTFATAVPDQITAPVADRQPPSPPPHQTNGQTSSPSSNGSAGASNTATISRPSLNIDIDTIIAQTLAERAEMLKEPNRDTAYLAFMGLLSAPEREKIVSAAYELGLDRKDPAWLNAWGDARASIHINAVLAKVVTIMESRLAEVDKTIAALREPQTYVVHADAGTVTDDIATLKGMITALKEQIEAMPYRSVNDVHRMTDPFVKLAEASTGLLRSIESLRNNAVVAIEEAVEAANETMTRTAFEKHALPAEADKKYHVISIGGIAIAIIVGVAVFLEPFFHLH